MMAKSEGVENVALVLAGELDVAHCLLIRCLDINAQSLSILEEFQTQSEIGVRLIDVMDDVIPLKVLYS